MDESKRQNKGQKLASAIYLITGFFGDSEPLKWRLRSLSLDLVAEKVKDKLSLAREMNSLLSVAKASGIVSEPNANIIIGELIKFEDDESKYFDIKALLGKPAEEILPLTEALRESEIKDKSSIKSLSYVSEEPKNKNLKDFGVVSVKKNTRQSVIIGLLKRKKEIMIKDVSAIISDCSEKTIQRELLGMVSSGILKKIGEKRWSRYALA